MSQIDPSPFGETPIETVAGWIRSAKSICVLTGAGISTESGIPDFRGPNGLWTKNPDAEKVSDIRYYTTDAELRKRNWHARRTNGIWEADPNAGHRALVDLEKAANLDLLVTQNIDGLHLQAGSDPMRVIEIHGTTLEAKCLACGWRGPMSETLDRVAAGEEDPACLECGGMLKSGTVSFGESLNSADLARSMRSAKNSDLFIAIGTSLGVFPVANLPRTALSTGARLIIINGEPTPYDDLADAVSHAPIGEVLPALVALI
ncbi:MAG: NAD-dependent deacylase [Actinomycetes bacterium]